MALPLAIGWTIYTAQPTPGNFLLGYLFSVAVVMATGLRGDSFLMRNPPRQLYNLVAYIVFLASEVLMSGLKISWIILTPRLPIDPGALRVNTQDTSQNELISAISAHGITITPGELVMDFEESPEGGVIMIVHSLNIEEARKNLDSAQSKRLKRIKGIIAYD